MLSTTPFCVFMKTFAWNVRGLNNDTRQLYIQKWLRANKPLIGGLLETHVAEPNLQSTINSLVPGWKFEANYAADADNGRIVVIWDPRLSVIFYHKSPQLVMCGVLDPATKVAFTVAFVYARNIPEERIPLWNQLREFASSSLISQSPWLIMGDFNQVLSVSEVYSITRPVISPQGMATLSDCLQDCQIFDMAFRGCEFTWTNKSPSNPKARKLDRALINEKWLERFPDSSAFFDSPGSSDHSPCLVSLSNELTSRKSRFMFFSMFTSHPEYHDLIREAWQDDITPSSPMSSLYHRLRRAKACCKCINRRSFSSIQQRTKEAFEKLEAVQQQLLSAPSVALFEEEQVARDSWIFLAAAEESFFHQKSRIQWLTDGDANTGVFHRFVKANLLRNIVHYLRDESDLKVYDPVSMKDMVTQYYLNLLGTSTPNLSPMTVENIQQIHPFRCSEDLGRKLAMPPSPEEIKAVVFALPKNKAPGPDGFTAEFFTTSWDLVGQDVISAVRDFFVNPSMLRQVNSTVISLIPKIPGADRLSDFRPISLCNTVYKIISKIIGKRLKLLTPLAVQRNQVGFVKGRLLCENVLLASELVSNFHKRGQVSRGCLQVDITKAYDNVSWKFVLNILQAFNLPAVFIDWIRTCISSPYYSIALNGELVGFFPGQKGLRQGDPISSSLFVIAMDILSKKLDQAALDNKFGLHPSCSDPLVTHLSFADDLLIFFDGSENSIGAILEILNEFHEVSGLGLNLRKTCLFLDGGSSSLSFQIAQRFGLAQDSLPVKYLGLPLMPHKLCPRDYQPLIDKVLARIHSWTVKRLSFAGRLQLLQSVIFSMISFWAAIYPLPQGCIETLEKICNAFLWSGDSVSARGAKVAWETVCSPKECGGLGLRRLADTNLVFGLKLIWLLFAGTGSLWVAWAQRNLIKDNLFWSADFRNVGSWLWRRLMNLRDRARPRLICQLHSGDTALFWHDNWTGLGPLIEVTGANGPRVTGIRSMSTVSQAVGSGRWLISRGRHPILSLLRSCLQDPPPISPGQSDIYLWKNSQEAQPAAFSYSKTSKSLHQHPLPIVPWHKEVWFSSNIPKHSFIAWISSWNRLPTRDRLRGWGMAVSSDCLLCGSSDESRDHLFFSCPFSIDVWSSFYHHHSLSPPPDFNSILGWLRTASSNPKVKFICKLLFQATIYFIWRERNSRLHLASSKPAHVIAKDIQITLKAKLAGLDRKALAPVTQTYLSIWFDLFHQ